MSKVINLVGAVNATDVQVKQQAAKLNFVYKTPNANAATLADFMNRINNVTINIELQGKNGFTENLVPKLTLKALAEIYSANEGEVEITSDGVDTTGRWSMELSPDGALLLNNELNIVINTTGGQANDVLDIYATDFPIQSTKALKTNIIRFNANAAQEVGLAMASYLHIPVASFDRLELYYPNGIVVTLLPDEVRQWAIEGNQVQANFKGSITMGAVNYFSINVADAVRAKLTQTADVNVFLFTEVEL